MLLRATIVLLLVLALPASASVLEGLTGGAVAYQFDGDGHHDAPDLCEDAAAPWVLAANGTTDGLLAPPDDSSDVFLVDVPATLVGERLTFAAVPGPGGHDLTLDAYLPDCSGSLLDPANWPRPQPAPPQPTTGQKQVQVANPQDPDYCDPRGWVFALDRVGVGDPTSIYVAWTDGSEHAIGLIHRTATKAYYATDQHLGVLVKNGWANVPAAATGGFRLVVGDCNATDGGAVYGFPPVVGDGTLAFTPTRAGVHVLEVTLAGGLLPNGDPPASIDPTSGLPMQPHELVQPLAGLAEQGAHDPTSLEAGDVFDALPSMSIPATCHFCLGDVEPIIGQVGYRLSASAAA